MNSQYTIAIHILSLLALSDKPLSSSYIAGSTNSNAVTIRNITGILRNNDLVKTLPGSTGGTLLTRKANSITLGEVYRAMQTAGRLFDLHPCEPNPQCPVGKNIQHLLLPVYQKAEEALISQLNKTTLADLARSFREHISVSGKNSQICS